MSCHVYEKYDQGKIGEEEFRLHSQTCPDCREMAWQDDRLLSLARGLKEPVRAPSLWTRIEQSLREEQQRGEKKRWASVFSKRWASVPLAAMLVVGLGLGLYFWLRPGLGESRLLSESFLRRVERREMRYERLIRRLEGDVEPQMADLGLDLMLLYRDRLEVIDEQILSCREALTENPGNAHIRRYMLAAFQEKEDTLREILKTNRQLVYGENMD